MEEDSFDQRKAASLKAIENSCEYDKSPKGSVDEPIRGLVDAINRSQDFATTSSCSGRISLFHVANSNMSSKGNGRWLLALHRTLSDPEELIRSLKHGLAQAKEPAESLTLFKHEPFVLHVMCRTIDGAQRFLKLAMDAGFRESGISVGARKIMVGIRTTANSLECPVARDGKILCSDDYLMFLADEANKRFKDNCRRTEQFEKAVVQYLGSTAEKVIDRTRKASLEMSLKWKDITPSYSLRRWGHSSNVLDDDHILIFGGWGESAGNGPEAQDKQQHTHLNHTVVFDVKKMQPRALACSREPDGRVYHGMVELENQACVLFGGRKSPLSPFGDWWLFSGLDESWQPLHPPENGPCARWRHAVCRLGPIIYVSSGRTPEAIMDDLWAVQVNAASVMAERLVCNGAGPGPRFAHAMLASRGKLMIHGGLQSFDAADGPRDVSVLDLHSHTWSTVSVDGLPWAFSHCMVTLDETADRFIILGGVERQYSRERLRGIDALEVDSVTLEARCIQLETTPSLLLVQSSAISVRDGATVLAFGGGATCFAFGSVFSSSAWLSKADQDVKPSKPLADEDVEWFWACAKSDAVSVKSQLATHGVLDKSRKVLTEGTIILFPIPNPDLNLSVGSAVQRQGSSLRGTTFSGKATHKLQSKDAAINQALNGARCKVECVDDVLLMHSREVSLESARSISAEQWNRVLDAHPGARRIVWGAEVDSGPMRRSQNILIYCRQGVVPDSCWVSVRENREFL
jgi:tRNA wybutosine-synthesizing protein 3